VLGLESLLALLVIVDQSESSGSTTSELGLESESGNSGLVGLVQSSELLVELGLGDGGTGGVKDVDNELTTVQQPVGNELPGADSDRAGGILESWSKGMSVKLHARIGTASSLEAVAYDRVGRGVVVVE
jgi:hypothetical protein